MQAVLYPPPPLLATPEIPRHSTSNCSLNISPLDTANESSRPALNESNRPALHSNDVNDEIEVTIPTTNRFATLMDNSTEDDDHCNTSQEDDTDADDDEHRNIHQEDDTAALNSICRSLTRPQSNHSSDPECPSTDDPADRSAAITGRQPSPWLVKYVEKIRKQRRAPQ